MSELLDVVERTLGWLLPLWIPSIPHDLSPSMITDMGSAWLAGVVSSTWQR